VRSSIPSGKTIRLLAFLALAFSCSIRDNDKLLLWDEA